MAGWKHIEGRTVLEEAMAVAKEIKESQRAGINVQGLRQDTMGKLDLAAESDIVSCPLVSDIPTLDQRDLDPPPTKIWCDQCAADIWYPAGHEGSKARKMCRHCANAFIKAHADDYTEEQ